MKVIRDCLVAVFSFLAVFKCWLVISVPLPVYFSVLPLLSLTVIAALFHKGGKVIRFVALAFCCLLAFCGMLFIAMVISTFFGQEYDSVSPFLLAVLSIVGGLAFVCLKRQKIGNFRHYT